MWESDIPQSVVEIANALKKNSFFFTNVKLLFGEDDVTIVVTKLAEGDQIRVF